MVTVSEKEIGASLNTIIVFWFLVWGLFSFVADRWAKDAKLIISADNIYCDDIASLVGFSTHWENILKIEVSKRHLVLWLKEPSIPITKVGQLAIKYSVIRSDAIDLSDFLDCWKSGELKYDFQKYAPHLFKSVGELANSAA